MSEQQDLLPSAAVDQQDERPAASPERLPRWELVALFVGDLIVFLIFAALGRSSHGLDAGSGLSLRGVLNTAIPFMTAWLLVGILAGTYRGIAFYPLLRVVGLTLLASLLTAPLGAFLRATWLGRPVIWTFVLVSAAMITLMMLIWRVGWSRLRRLWWTELP